jgi:hypothetical protein
MLQVKIYIDTRRKTNKGYPVKLQIYCTLLKKRKNISLNLYQNSKTKQSPEAQEALAKLLTRIEPIKDFPLDKALPLLENESDLERIALEERLKKYKTHVDFFKFSEKLIQEREVEGKSTQAFKDAIREVRNFMGDEKFGLNDITYEWVKNYRLFKLRNGTNEGGISYYLRTLRTIHNEATRRESLGIQKSQPFKGLIKNSPSLKHLNKEWKASDIQKLKHFKHPNTTKATQKTIQRAAHLFLFQIAVGGVDFVDIANLHWSNIESGRIKFQRYKNRNKPNAGEWVDNMLSDFALKVIRDYGTPDDDRVFSFLPDPEGSKYTHRHYAKTLQRISEVLNIEPRLTTKTPRYLFRTIAGNLLIHDLVVESLLGHKPTTISHKYQRGIPNNIKDQEHQKILDEIFLSPNSLKRLEKEGLWDSDIEKIDLKNITNK